MRWRDASTWSSTARRQKHSQLGVRSHHQMGSKRCPRAPVLWQPRTCLPMSMRHIQKQNAHNLQHLLVIFALACFLQHWWWAQAWPLAEPSNHVMLSW